MAMRIPSILQRLVCVFALIAPVFVAEPSSASPVGVVAVAPHTHELGTGWAKRELVFAIDPNEQPDEYPKDRAALVETVRRALSRNGSVGMAELWYTHSGYRQAGQQLELVISRYPDQPSLDARWKELSGKFDVTIPAPEVGRSAAWLKMADGSSERMIIFQQGLFIGWVTCKAELCGEPLMQLLTATADKMIQIAEQAAPPNGGPAPPVGNSGVFEGAAIGEIDRCARALRDGGINAVSALNEALKTALAGLPPESGREIKHIVGRAMATVLDETVHPAVQAFPELEIDSATWIAIANSSRKCTCILIKPAKEAPSTPMQ
jgi:hypothetical protein